MWMKAIGVVCVLLSGSIWGLNRAAKFSNRTKQLRVLKFAIKRLETEINYGLTPLLHGLKKVAETSEYPIQALFRLASTVMENQQLDMNQAWRTAIAEHWPHLDLRQQEKELLIQFGTTLGISNREDQVKHIQLFFQHLTVLEEQAVADQLKHEQSSKSMGLILAILIVLLFV